MSKEAHCWPGGAGYDRVDLYEVDESGNRTVIPWPDEWVSRVSHEFLREQGFTVVIK